MKTSRFATQLIWVLGTVLMTLGWLAFSHSPARSASSPVPEYRLVLLQTELGFLAELMGDTKQNQNIQISPASIATLFAFLERGADT